MTPSNEAEVCDETYRSKADDHSQSNKDIATIGEGTDPAVSWFQLALEENLV